MKKMFPRSDADVTDPFESEEFYELCQVYRHSPAVDQAQVVQAFEKLKEFGRNASKWGIEE